jgi:hypothetical protein
MPRLSAAATSLASMVAVRLAVAGRL